MKSSSCDVTSCNDLGRIGGGGWVYPKGTDSMAVSGLRFRHMLVGSGCATAVLLCMNGLRKQSSHPALSAYFWLRSLYPSLGEWLPVECRECCKLVNGWVWFVVV